MGVPSVGGGSPPNRWGFHRLGGIAPPTDGTFIGWGGLAVLPINRPPICPEFCSAFIMSHGRRFLSRDDYAQSTRD
ncbi:hypothetical protein Taro_047577 [Colocasia esculenta]|uniref:Uncharacterized protein n=1 Tax=Colocasia esculenta TaxID=4460 RepID=A0A843X5K8_COLES|nr:hypothetical protein [Colocasia esculenta]